MYSFLAVIPGINPCINNCIIPMIKNLLLKYRNVLTDDYSSEDFDEFLMRISPHLYAGFKNGEFAGFVYLDDWRGGGGIYHSCTMTVCIERKFWGKVSREISRTFISRIFSHYGLYKLKAFVFENNRNAGNFLLSLGFKKEALLKGETFKKGVPANMWLYSVFKNEFIQQEK